MLLLIYAVCVPSSLTAAFRLEGFLIVSALNIIPFCSSYHNPPFTYLTPLAHLSHLSISFLRPCFYTEIDITFLTSFFFH